VRPDIRQLPAPTAAARPIMANVPHREQRVMRAAPAPQPAAPAAVARAVHAAPPAAQAQRQAPPSGNNQPGNTPGTGDRGTGGRWGNMTRGN
jgi:hypothetical protein